MDGWVTITRQMYEGPLWGAGAHVHALWEYILINADSTGTVYIRPEIAAMAIGCLEELIVDAIDYLASPGDGHSPLIVDGGEEGRWIVVDYHRYVFLDEDFGRRFRPPTADEVQRYLDSIGESRFTGQQFVDYYTSKGWLVGKSRMKDWRAAVRTWRSKEKLNGLTRPKPAAPPPPPKESGEFIEDTIGKDEEGRLRIIRIWRDVSGREIRRRFGDILEGPDDVGL